jgi:hypothetical protein
MKEKGKWILALLLSVKFVLPFFLSNSGFELHRDEYLYYEQGRHLAFGYSENPPLIGVLAYISSLFGGSYFWIKFWPALFWRSYAVGYSKDGKTIRWQYLCTNYCSVGYFVFSLPAYSLFVST